MDYKNFKCKQNIAGALVEECTQNIDENEMTYNGTLNAVLLDEILLNDYKKVCSFCVVFVNYKVLFAVFLVPRTVISTALFIFIGIQKNITNALLI